MITAQSPRVELSDFNQAKNQSWASLNSSFQAGALPNPVLNGRYSGKLIALDIAPGLTTLIRMIAGAWMPWHGKLFDPNESRGDNIFSRDSFALAHIYWPSYHHYVDDGHETYRAFTFQTRVAPGVMDSDRQVLQLDYGLPENPGLSVRRVIDELVQVDDSLYLGKAHLRWWWGKWQTVAFFSLRKEPHR